MPAATLEAVVVRLLLSHQRLDLLRGHRVQSAADIRAFEALVLLHNLAADEPPPDERRGAPVAQRARAGALGHPTLQTAVAEEVVAAVERPETVVVERCPERRLRAHRAVLRQLLLTGGQLLETGRQVRAIGREGVALAASAVSSARHRAGVWAARRARDGARNGAPP